MEFWVQVIFYYNIIKRRQQQEKHKTQNIGWNVKKFNPFLRRMHLIEFCVCLYFSNFFSKECYISLLSLKIFVRIYVFFCNRWWSQQIIYMKCILICFSFFPHAFFLISYGWVLKIFNSDLWHCYKYFFIYLFMAKAISFFTSMKTKIIIKSFSFFIFFFSFFKYL